MSNAVIGALRVNLGLDTAAFQEGVKNTRSQLGKMGPMLKRAIGSLAALGAAAAAAGVKAAAAARDLQQQAQLSNASIEEFQRAAHAAKQVGVEQEQLADILKDVNDRVGDFLATGAGPMADFFENIAPQVGLTVENFKELSGPQALQAYVKALEDAGVSQQEMTFYLEAMASDASKLTPLLANNGAEMARLGDEAERMGLVNADAAVAGAKLNEAFTKMTAALTAVGVAIVETGIVDLLAAILNTIADMIPKIIEATRVFREWVSGVVETVTQMVDDIAAQFARLGDLVPSVGDILDGISGLWRKHEDEMVGNSIVPDMIDDIVAEYDRLARDAPRIVERTTGALADGFTDLATAALDKSRSVGDTLRSLGLSLAEFGIRAGVNAAFGLPIPGFAAGTNFAPGGLAIVGERGPELVNLPRGSQVVPNSDLGGMGRVEIMLGEGLEARMLDRAAQQSVVISRRQAADVSNAVIDRRVRGGTL